MGISLAPVAKPPPRRLADVPAQTEVNDNGDCINNPGSHFSDDGIPGRRDGTRSRDNPVKRQVRRR
ncbi:hypothetical protein SBA5_720013 [Candidatus Sulfotelmatomonas gaucii]|uniref:Uncharacterized protein n=1 Tax=Candidatus Sulfuritelmatomonas gaucii TaxID=2043161 RepID=A0A2N9M317_9BACT|nr:hypothetical protein SBA5_720013 [Candidatus Sulfotelmatomonas gaucii]